MKNLQKIAKNLLIAIGEDPTRIGLKDTPKRMAKMWEEVFKGYDRKQMPNITIFPNNKDGVSYNQIIIDKGQFTSHCEHHMALFKGDYYFGYIPDKYVIGLSKIGRLVDYYSSRMQIQERLGDDIVSFLYNKLKPRGMILILKARHTCKEIRGVKKNGEMITSVVRGIFETDISAKEEFLQLIKI